MKNAYALLFFVVCTIFPVACGDDSGTQAGGMGSSSSGKANWALMNPEISYGELTDARDGQVYRTVEIGDQIWMAENLNYAYMPDTLSFCYNDSAEYCEKYGRLYTWSAAMDSAAIFSEDGKGCSVEQSGSPSCGKFPVRGICPEGWHFPSNNEWKTLDLNYLLMFCSVFNRCLWNFHFVTAFVDYLSMIIL